jgi:hypothetical protein
VLAKGHSFVHPPINFILWYVPTIPLGGAIAGVALALSIENCRLWGAADATRRAITVSRTYAAMETESCAQVPVVPNAALCAAGSWVHPDDEDR